MDGNKQGTLKRTINIQADKIAEFEVIAKNNGWIVDNLANDMAILKNIPQKQFSPSEIEEINACILAESKKYRHATFRF